MVRRAFYPAPVSFAAAAAMFAFGALAQEPAKPLPFELFHGAKSGTGGQDAAVAPEHGETSAESHGAANPHQPAAGMVDGAGDDAAADPQSAETEGVKAPFSEPAEVAGLEIGE
ncbi:MAG: hypothetical protein KI789_13700, partial [Hoeflea sp.]|nr:hypothetical protein [Hoeflea sp.]